MVDQVGDVDRFFDLFPKYLFDARVIVTQRVDGNSGQQIQVALVGFIDQICAGSAVGEKLVPAVSPQQILFLQFFDVRQLHFLSLPSMAVLKPSMGALYLIESLA